jgi:polyisoprenoid-binding protein YceI
MNLSTRFAVLGAALLTAAPALAADSYSFDKAHSTVGFQIRHIFTNVGGTFREFEGTIDVDRAKPSASAVAFTIQAASIDTREPKRDAHLRSADFFDVATFPTITFKSTSVTPKGGDLYEVGGQLTMHGVTKSVTLPVRFLGEGKDPWGHEKMGFELETTLNRKDYGIVWNQNLDKGALMLGDDVKVQVAVEANKAKPAATTNQ